MSGALTRSRRRRESPRPLGAPPLERQSLRPRPRTAGRAPPSAPLRRPPAPGRSRDPPRPVGGPSTLEAVRVGSARPGRAKLVGERRGGAGPAAHPGAPRRSCASRAAPVRARRARARIESAPTTHARARERARRAPARALRRHAQPEGARVGVRPGLSLHDVSELVHHVLHHPASAAPGQRAGATATAPQAHPSRATSPPRGTRLTPHPQPPPSPPTRARLQTKKKKEDSLRVAPHGGDHLQARARAWASSPSIPLSPPSPSPPSPTSGASGSSSSAASMTPPVGRPATAVAAAWRRMPSTCASPTTPTTGRGARPPPPPPSPPPQPPRAAVQQHDVALHDGDVAPDVVGERGRRGLARGVRRAAGGSPRSTARCWRR